VITAEIWGCYRSRKVTDPSRTRRLPEPIMGVSAPVVSRPVRHPKLMPPPSSRTNPDLMSRVGVYIQQYASADVEVYMSCVERSEVERGARSSGLERGADRVVGHQ
jgi:hypothetical protein